jgi:hypothetical protein
MCGECCKKQVSSTLRPKTPIRIPLENTFGVIHLHCGSNNNQNVGQLVNALKSSIINDLAFRGLSNTNCKDDKTELVDN